jgi:hypothetical protein
MPPKQRAAMNGTKPQLREFEFIIQPVLLAEGPDGVPVRQPTAPVVVSGLAGVREFADGFPAKLDALNEEYPGLLEAAQLEQLV